MTGLLGILFGVAFFVWFFVSPFVVILWFFEPESRDSDLERHERITMALYVGAFISLNIVLGQGIIALLVFINRLLVFIPADWGSSDFANFISHLLAFYLSIFLVHVFDKFEKMRIENQRLSTIEEILKRKDGLRYFSRERLKERRDRTEAELKQLRDRPYEVRSSEERKELCVLEKLLDELDYRIREAEPSEALEEE